MESLIVFIIIGVLSSLLGKKKPGKEKPKQNRPTTTVTENPFKNLGDFAKDFMEDQRRQMENQPPVIQPAALPIEKEEVQQVREPKKVTPRPGRLSVHNEQKKVKVQVEKDSSFIPTSKEDLLRAVVFSEILAPPKSRR